MTKVRVCLHNIGCILDMCMWFFGLFIRLINKYVINFVNRYSHVQLNIKLSWDTGTYCHVIPYIKVQLSAKCTIIIHVIK